MLERGLGPCICVCVFVCSLERVISEAEEIEAEPCRSSVASDLDVNAYSEKKIETLVRKQDLFYSIYYDVFRLDKKKK